MKVGCCIAIVLLLLISDTAGAEYVFHNVSEVQSDVRYTAVASSPEGMIVVAWTVMGEGIWTRTIHLDMFEAPVFHGEGLMPTVCWNHEGFTLAWASGPLLLIRSGDGFSWSDMELFETPGGGDVGFPKLTGAAQNLDFHDIYLTWEERQGEVWLSRRSGGAWALPEIISLPPEYDFVQPLALPTGTDEVRVYHLNEASSSIDYYQGDFGSGLYSSHQIWPNMTLFGMDFDATIGPLNDHKILSLGPLPACPCNHIHFSAELEPDIWSEPENLTIYQSYYSCPQFPCIAEDGDATVHAYWYQSFYDSMMEQCGEDLYYFTRPAYGVWEDHSDLFEDEIGKWCAMTLGAMELPVFVYAKGDYPHLEVWLARDQVTSAAPETPTAPLRLWAGPNPFNPRTTLSFSLPAAGRIELALFDISGRRMATLLDEHRDAGMHKVDWNGTDDSGRRLGSGVYLARITSDAGSTGAKLVMLK